MKRPGALVGMEVLALGFTAVAAVGSIYWQSPRMTLGVIAGGLLMVGNLWVIRRVVEDLMEEADEAQGETRRKKRRLWLVFQYVLKLLALLAIIGGLLKWGGVDPAGLIIGVSVALLAMLTAAFRAAAKENS